MDNHYWSEPDEEEEAFWREEEEARKGDPLNPPHPEGTRVVYDNGREPTWTGVVQESWDPGDKRSVRVKNDQTGQTYEVFMSDPNLKRQDVGAENFRHPDPWMDNEPGAMTFPQHWTTKVADYQGRTNWDTWHTGLMMDKREHYDKARKIVHGGGTPQDLRDWATQHVIGPYNKQQVADAQDWNEIPEDERVDHHWEELNAKNPDAARLVEGLGFGKDVSDSTPQLIDHDLVNWDELHSDLMDEKNENDRYKQESDRLKGMGLSPDWMTPGHDDDIQHMREAMYRHHGALPDEEMKAENGGGYTGKDPRSVYNRTVNIPFDELTQRHDFNLENHISLDTRNALWGDANDRQIQKIWEQEAQEHPDMDPTRLQDLAENTWYRSTPLSERDKYTRNYDPNDPHVKAIIDQDPQWQETVKNGYNQRLTDYTWDTINDLHKGLAHPNQKAAMEAALTGQGHAPEAVANMVAQRRRWNPDIKRWENLKQKLAPPKNPSGIDPNLDQRPGDLTIPPSWTAAVEPDWSMVPPCPHCGKDALGWRDDLSKHLYPDGAWNCYNCFNVVPAGELPVEPPRDIPVEPQVSPQHPDPWMDNEPGSLTLPPTWSSVDPWEPVDVATWTSLDPAQLAKDQFRVAKRAPQSGRRLKHRLNYQRGNDQVNRKDPNHHHGINVNRHRAAQHIKVHRTSSNGIQILTAYDDDKPVGYTQAAIKGGDVIILYAFVDPDHRGKGLGRKMVDELVKTYPGKRISTTVETPEGQALMDSFKRSLATEDAYGVLPGGAKTVHRIRKGSDGRYLPYCAPRSRYTASPISPEEVQEAKEMGYAMCRRCF